MSAKEAVALELLCGASRELYGLEMVETSKGQLKRGTVYVTLDRMEERGLLTSRLEPNPIGELGRPRRMYRLTGAGQRAFDVWRAGRAAEAAKAMELEWA